jgi:phenylpyruvate tautomerase PptA (4-oxalocrotonate tautomerase family)
MPIARIEVKKSWSPGQQQHLVQALHAAMMEALKVPEWDRQIRFVEHLPEHFLTPPGTSENYTLVELSLFSGRSLEAKRNLYQGIVRRFGELGIKPDDVFIVLNEVPMDNWGIRGGVPASEIELGFKIDV